MNRKQAAKQASLKLAAVESGDWLDRYLDLHGTSAAVKALHPYAAYAGSLFPGGQGFLPKWREAKDSGDEQWMRKLLEKSNTEEGGEQIAQDVQSRWRLLLGLLGGLGGGLGGAAIGGTAAGPSDRALGTVGGGLLGLLGGGALGLGGGHLLGSFLGRHTRDRLGAIANSDNRVRAVSRLQQGHPYLTELPFGKVLGATFGTKEKDKEDTEKESSAGRRVTNVTRYSNMNRKQAAKQAALKLAEGPGETGVGLDEPIQSDDLGENLLDWAQGRLASRDNNVGLLYGAGTGAGLGAGIGALMAALSDKEKKPWLSNLLLGAGGGYLVGGGIGGNEGVQNWARQSRRTRRQAPRE